MDTKSRTVFDLGHVAIDIMRNLQISCQRHGGLFICECIQLLERILNVLPSHQLLQNLFCAMISKERHRNASDSLIRLSSMTLVESARMQSNCAINFPSNSVNSSVRGMPV